MYHCSKTLLKKALAKAKDFLTDLPMLVSYASALLTLVPTAHLIQFECRWRNSILFAIFLFPYLMIVDSILSLLEKCTVSYQAIKTDHWGTRRTMMTLISTKPMANLFLQLEGSEQQ